MLFDELAHSQVFVQLSGQNQTPIRSHPRPLEINFQKSVEPELKRPVLFFTHWLSTLRGVLRVSEPSWIKASESIRRLGWRFQNGNPD
jgi:hypothetical protein